MKRLFQAYLLSFILFLFLEIVLVSGAWASSKKGVGLADLNATDRITALNLAWYYTWKPEPIKDVPLDLFVPMVSGRFDMKKQIEAVREQSNVPLLLAVNEPNKKKQANMSVEKVLRIWPELSGLADQISSPAPAGVLGPWFDKFHRMSLARGLKYDFMAVHLYGPPNPEKFLKKIDAVYEKYGVPIWITEFAVADWGTINKPGRNRYSEAQVLEFMKQVLPELEKREYIVRYAWFGAGNYFLRNEQVRTSRLFEKDGVLTLLGRYYAEFFWPHSKGSGTPR